MREIGQVSGGKNPIAYVVRCLVSRSLNAVVADKERFVLLFCVKGQFPRRLWRP